MTNHLVDARVRIIGFSVSVFLVLVMGMPAQRPHFVADINQVPRPHGSHPRPGAATMDRASFVSIGSTAFFVADDGSHGLELFRSDGTKAGTRRVTDINPGDKHSSPTQLTEVGGKLFFSAFGPSRGLWTLDPATDRLTQVSMAAQPSSPFFMIELNGVAIFTAETSAAGWELWRSDGTAAGTRMIVDLVPGRMGSSSIPFFTYKGQVFFRASGGTYATDGTAAGTRLMASAGIATNALGEHYPATRSFVPFRTLRGQLWVTDGTPAGTRQVTGPIPYDKEFVWLNGVYLFGATTAASGIELWKTDGTAAGTVQIKDINPGVPGSWVGELTALGNAVYFRATEAVGGVFFWRSDGTAVGTARMYATSPVGLVAAHGSLWFRGSDGELWLSNGTTVGTRQVRDIYPGGQSIPRYLTAASASTVLFSANNGSGTELWKSNGTLLGTSKVKDLSFGGPTYDSDPGQFVDFKGMAFFAADDGVSGRELWRSNGTAAGTSRVGDLVPGTGSSYPKLLTPLGERMLLVAGNPTGGELWSTDGSSAGSLKIDLRRAAGDSNPRALTVFRGAVYFAADGDLGQASSIGIELWRSDGTRNGTQLVADARIGSSGSRPTHLMPFGGYLYFAADGNLAGVKAGRELWRSDGLGNTALFADLVPGTVSSTPRNMTRIGNRFVFSAASVGGREIWISDGTRAGTRMIDILRGAVGSDPSPEQTGATPGFVVAGDAVYFVANGDLGLGAPSGRAIWRITVAGQVSLVSRLPGPGCLTGFGRKLLFLADSGKIYMSDGTPAGTVLQWGIGPAAGSFLVAGPRYYFTQAKDYANIPMFLRNRLPSGGLQQTQVYFTAGSACSTDSAKVRGVLMFAGDGSKHGRELWLANPGATAWSVGSGCAASGDPAVLSADDPAVGKQFTLRLQRAPVNRAGLLAVGAPGGPLHLGAGCNLHLASILAVLPFQTDAAGRWNLPLFVPNGAIPARVQAVLAATGKPPLGVDFTNGLSLTPGY